MTTLEQVAQQGNPLSYQDRVAAIIENVAARGAWAAAIYLPSKAVAEEVAAALQTRGFACEVLTLLWRKPCRLVVRWGPYGRHPLERDTYTITASGHVS